MAPVAVRRTTASMMSSEEKLRKFEEYQENMVRQFEDEKKKKDEIIHGRNYLLQFLHGMYRGNLTDADMKDHSPAVKKFMGLEHAPTSELHMLVKRKVLERFERFPGDTGSTLCQVAMLTFQIEYLNQHFRMHRKDLHGIRGLNGMLAKRKKLMLYMKKNEFNDYVRAVNELGLKPVRRMDDAMLGRMKTIEIVDDFKPLRQFTRDNINITQKKIHPPRALTERQLAYQQRKERIYMKMKTKKTTAAAALDKDGEQLKI